MHHLLVWCRIEVACRRGHFHRQVAAIPYAAKGAHTDELNPWRGWQHSPPTWGYHPTNYQRGMVPYIVFTDAIICSSLVPRLFLGAYICSQTSKNIADTFSGNYPTLIANKKNIGFRGESRHEKERTSIFAH